MPITYGSVCSDIVAATQAWHPLGMRAAWRAEIEHYFTIAPIFRTGEHPPSVNTSPQGSRFEIACRQKREARTRT